MFRKFDDLSSEKKRIAGITAIVLVIGSWIIIPLAAKILYDISSIDVAMAITAFYAAIWFAHKAYRKYR